MSEAAEVLAALHEVRIPEAGHPLGDGLAGVSIGLAASILLSLAATAFLHRRSRQREVLRAELARGSGMPPEERLLHRAKLLSRIARDIEARTSPAGSRLREDCARLRATIRGALYRPGCTIEIDRLDEEISALIGRIGG